MNNKAINKETIMKSVAKMVSDKAMVRLFLKGYTPIEKLTQKGINFAKPI